MFSLKYGAFGHRVLHMENAETVQIRLLEEGDPPSIAAAFKNMGWNKPETQYGHYLHEQVAELERASSLSLTRSSPGT
jgi:hypothetical protein